MTRFIESFATQQLLPPWEAHGAQTWGFVVRLTERAIRRYLDGYFNGAYPDRAPYHYTPLPGPAHFGLVSAALFPKIASLNKHTASRLGDTGVAWDHLHHTEVYLAFPVLRYDLTPDNLISNPTLVWVEPFIFSDNDSVVFSSREIWGSDMYLGNIVREQGLRPHQLHLDLGTMGIKKFNPRSTTELLAALHLRTGGDSEVGLDELLKQNPDIQDFVKVLGGSAAFASGRPGAVGPSPFTGGTELNNLKQFRDCYDMDAAVYRAIVASRTIHTEVDNIVLFDPAKCEIDFMWSDSLGEVLAALFDVERPNELGAPQDHREAAKKGPFASPEPVWVGPPPAYFNLPLTSTPNVMDWRMDRLKLQAELAFSFSSKVRFEVIDTIHTYGLSGA